MKNIIIAGLILLVTNVLQNLFPPPREWPDAEGKKWLDRANSNHAVHSFGIILAGVLGQLGFLSHSAATIVMCIFLAGLALYVTSLYALAFPRTRKAIFKPVGSIGAVVLIAGWLTLLFAMKLSL